MEEAPENGKELLHSVRANGIEFTVASNCVLVLNCYGVQVSAVRCSRCYLYFLLFAFYIPAPTFTVPLALLIIYSMNSQVSVTVFIM
jgi:hypothetical protein